MAADADEVDDNSYVEPSYNKEDESDESSASPYEGTFYRPARPAEELLSEEEDYEATH